jgi:vacuolar-type H+-ATPase subunit I/STV1
VQAQLAKQLEAQAEKEGFAGDHTDSFLTKEDREQLERARPRDVDKAAAMQVINKMKQAKRVFKRQVKDPKYIKKLEKEVAELRKQLGKQQSKVSTSKTRAKKAVEQRQKQAKGANRDQLKAMLRSELDRAKMYGADRDSAVKVFAKMNKVPLADAQKLAKDL